MDNFKSIVKRIKWETVLMALTAIIVGIAFIAAPASSGAVIGYLAGALLLCIGIYCFVKFFTMRFTLSGFMFAGIILMLVGIFFLVRPAWCKACLPCCSAFILFSTVCSKFAMVSNAFVYTLKAVGLCLFSPRLPWFSDCSLCSERLPIL